MAYQNVATPRIYVNLPEYLASTGAVIDPIFRTLPAYQQDISTTLTLPDISAFTLTDANSNSLAYIALLGHTETSYTVDNYASSIINGDTSGCQQGFSISQLSDAPTELTDIDNPIGSVVYGLYYDFPHSPDLNLTLSYEYDGVKEQTTRGGATLTNKFYTTQPKWTPEIGAWEIAGGNSNYARSGRRVWSLNFSYLSDSDVFPDNAALVNETADGNLTLLQDNTFQRVLHLTDGGQIPFIFQSDNTVSATSPKPDQLAICKLDQSSFQFKQVANSVYNVKLKIREVW